jgi:hypothetical protein
VTAGNNWQRAWATGNNGPNGVLHFIESSNICQRHLQFQTTTVAFNTPEEDPIDESILEHGFEVEYKF